MFTHLHVHTEYSPLDGASHLGELVARAASDGQTALAITDHGNIGAAWAFQHECERARVKPIIGCEVYLAIGSRFERHTLETETDESADYDSETTRTKAKRYYHLTLIARNKAGWRNLNRILVEAEEHVWSHPRIDYELLAANADGLIVLTGCLGGPVLGNMSQSCAFAAKAAAAGNDLSTFPSPVQAEAHAVAADLMAARRSWDEALADIPEVTKYPATPAEAVAGGITSAEEEVPGPLLLAAQRWEEADSRARQLRDPDSDLDPVLLAGLVAKHSAAAEQSEALARENLDSIIAAVGRENVYIEIMEHGIEKESAALPKMAALADEYSLPLVASNDSHYTAPEDAATHEAILAMQSGKALDDPKRFHFHGAGYHLRTEAEMRALRPETWWQSACDNTALVADRVEPRVMPDARMRLPKYPVPDGYPDEMSYLHHLVAAGAKRIYGNPLPDNVRERLRTEMSVIGQMGFPAYFLIVHDMIRWAKDHDIIVGPGRGCLTAEAQVWTTQGMKSINDVEIGDLVRTHTGAIRPVENRFKYEIDEPLVTLRTFHDGSGVTMTQDHKVLSVPGLREELHERTKGGAVWPTEVTEEPTWVAAKDVSVGDLLCVPVPPSPGTAPAVFDVAETLPEARLGQKFTVTDSEIIERIPVNRPYRSSVRDVSRRAGVSRSALQALAGARAAFGESAPDALGRRSTPRVVRARKKAEEVLRADGFDSFGDWDSYVHEHSSVEIRTPRFVPLNDDLLFLLGAMASNGWLRGGGDQRRLGWAERRSTSDTRIRDAVKRIWGLTVRTAESKTTDLVQYNLCSAAVFGMFSAFLPGYEQTAQTKRLPDWIADLSEGQKRTLLEGLWWGDGSKSDAARRWSYSSSSPMLTAQVRDLIWALHAPAGVKTDDRVDNRAEFKNRAPSWQVRTTPDFGPTQQGLWYGGKRYVYQRVRSKTTEQKRTTVYDLQVPVDHSFMTDSFVVHNSAAGSLVSYCLDIVTIDPLRHHLLFERFLEPGRKGMPDIDTDFEKARFGEVYDWAQRTYGHDSVARIGTFMIATTKRAIKDAARVHRLSGLGDRLSKAVPVVGGKPYTFAQLADQSDLKGEKFRSVLARAGSDGAKIVDLAERYSNTIAGTSVHACGVIISGKPLVGNVPLRLDPKEATEGRQVFVTQWTGPELEDLGLLKMDMLRIRNLDVIAKAIEYIEATTGERIDYYGLPDPDTQGDPRVSAAWQLLRDGRTAGVFQMDSDGMRKLTQQVQPTEHNDLTAILALYRPGPMGAGMHETYARRKTGREEVDYTYLTDDPTEAQWIDTVLGDTFGVFVYQEQLMRLGTVVSGFDASMRSKLRKAVGKKKRALLDEVFTALREGAGKEFRDEAGEVFSPVFSAQTVERLIDAMQGAAAYLFNQSHAAAYAQVAFNTAYLKANWPAAYGAAILACTDDEEKRLTAINSLREEGVTILPPDVNASLSATFPEDDTSIRLGLSEVKGVGVVGDALVEHRPAEGYTSLGHLREALGSALNVGALENLICSGACDRYGPRLGQMTVSRALASGESIPIPAAEFGLLERSVRERNLLGVSLSENPLARYKAQVKAWRVPGVEDSEGAALGARAIPVHRIPDAEGARVVIAGILASAKERAYSKGQMLSVTIEGGKSSIRGVMWAEDLVSQLRSEEGLPAVGSVVAASARVRVREVEVTDERGEVIDVEQVRELNVMHMWPIPIDERLHEDRLSVDAAEQAFALMREQKVQRFVDLQLPPSEFTELETSLLRPLRKRPVVTVTVCPVCGRHRYVTGSTSAKCTICVGCTGQPVKALTTAARAPRSVSGRSEARESPAEQSPAGNDPDEDSDPAPADEEKPQTSPAGLLSATLL
ncbi:DNA polymerase III subunit alpha [Pseudoclavibacter sp. CFCC 14310]|uniref:DNA polymerase III subunit alpha n=1 Tax=Pseudoclavibacter sp. CFCC 14310 TaxID=2615180 RepID=UPI00130130BF|nr:DNA polymerase III subunit alpha [Pseudoclavibacter sp. CFCC 14310]KAB1646163.1 DNA polymerase III subunit alpha [Pseudoclavibacter sp. CFCC 14310]